MLSNYTIYTGQTLNDHTTYYAIQRQIEPVYDQFALSTAVDKYRVVSYFNINRVVEFEGTYLECYIFINKDNG